MKIDWDYSLLLGISSEEFMDRCFLGSKSGSGESIVLWEWQLKQ